jgi:hypothetical protein
METLILLLATLIILIALDRGDAAARALRRPDVWDRAVGMIAPPGNAHQLIIPATSKAPSQASPQGGVSPAWRTLATASPAMTRWPPPSRRCSRRGFPPPRVVSNDAAPSFQDGV